jgi:hypothetical protein
MKIFRWNNPIGKWLVAGFLAVFLAGFVNECRAENQLELSGGYSTGYTWVLPPTGIMGEASYLVNDLKWDFSVGFIGTQQLNNNVYVKDYWYASITRVVHWGFRDAPKVLPYLGFGLSARESSQNVEYLLPQWWNFSLQYGFDYGEHWRVEGRHFSNAGIKEPNRGQNMILVGYRF